MLEEVGDGLRSQFLHHFRNLSVPALPACFRRTRWTNRLPLNTAATFAAQTSVPIKDVAQLADKTADITPLLVSLVYLHLMFRSVS